MGILNQKCDSCDKKVDVLFPILMLDELPSGGEGMVTRYYCVECKEQIEAEAGDAEEEDEEEKEKEDDEGLETAFRIYDCGCKYKCVNYDMEIWKRTDECTLHGVDTENSEIGYHCGCRVELITIDIFTYHEVCDKHE